MQCYTNTRILSLLRFMGIFLLVFDGLYAGALKTKDLDRPYDVVVIKGEKLPIFVNANVNVANLFVYAYKSNAGGWQQIPFQIDERDNGSYFDPHDGQLGANDEICFLTSDMGDSVDANTWISDSDSRLNQRYTISAIDTLGSTHHKAWAYVYLSSTIQPDPAVSTYMTYTPPSDVSAGDDSVKGYSYVFGHSAMGIPDYLAISEDVDGSGQDILDRWKIRISGALGGLPSFFYDETEDSSLDSVQVQAAVGPVRVIRKVSYVPRIMGAVVNFRVDYISMFYPWIMSISTGSRSLDQYMGVQLLRQSMDFLPNTTGSIFYSQMNSNILVDGVLDVVNTNLNTPGIIWYMLKSSHGIVTTVADIPNIGTDRELYYLDHGPVDGDTGDGWAYGDMGVVVRDASAIVGTFGLDMTMYFLSPNATQTITAQTLGDTLAQQFAGPLEVNAVPHFYVVPVELNSFAVKTDGNDVILTWNTGSETNNLGFEVLRQDGDALVESAWKSRGFVEGMGTSSEPHAYSYLDQNVAAGVYKYKLQQVDTDGKSFYSEVERAVVALPTTLSLQQNFPNPFNPTTVISFEVPAMSGAMPMVTLEVFNTQGQKIRVLVNNALEPGKHIVQWDGLNEAGSEVATGTYLYRLKINDEQKIQKMIKLH